MAEPQLFELQLVAEPSDIDELGHVNNAVYVRWIQNVATAHWQAVAHSADIARWVWVVTRHEIDYLRATGPGEAVTLRTWVGEPRGARFERFVEIIGGDGCIRVKARTVWALLDRASLRPLRIPAALAAAFVS